MCAYPCSVCVQYKATVCVFSILRGWYWVTLFFIPGKAFLPLSTFLLLPVDYCVSTLQNPH